MKRKIRIPSTPLYVLMIATLVVSSSLILGLMTMSNGSEAKVYDPDNFIEVPDPENPYKIVKEPVTIKIFAPHSAANPEYQDLKMFKQLSKLTNLNFSFITPDTSAYANIKSAAWQNKDLPDLFLFNNDLAEQVQFMEEGTNAYTPFNKDDYVSEAINLATGKEIVVGNLIDNYMPTYKAYLEDNFGLSLEQSGSAKAVATLSDGNMYSTLSVGDVARDLTYKLFINQKWIDNLNNDYDLGLKNSDKFETLDDFYDVLHAFKIYDANGNNKKNDEIPVSAASMTYLRNYILASYGYVNPSIEIEADKSSFTYVPLTDAYRNYLIFAHKLYQEGILDEKVFDLKTDVELTKRAYNKNTVGCFVGAAAYIVVGDEHQAEYKTVVPVNSDEYTGPKLHWGFSNFKPDGATIPTASVYVREVARLLDVMYSDVGQQLIAYGIENEDWTWDDEEHTSWTFHVPESFQGSQEEYRSQITPNTNTGSALYWSNNFVGKMNDEIITSLNRMSELYTPFLKIPVPYEVKLNSKEYDEVTTVKAALDKQIEFYESEFIIGHRDPNDDSEWEKFISDIKGFECEKIAKCYNDALARYLLEE